MPFSLRRHSVLLLSHLNKNDFPPPTNGKDLSQALAEFGQKLELIPKLSTIRALPPSSQEEEDALKLQAEKREAAAVLQPQPQQWGEVEDDVEDAEVMMRKHYAHDFPDPAAKKRSRDKRSLMIQRKMEAGKPAPKKAKTICKYFMDGMCNKGAECPFSHAAKPRPQEAKEVCRFFRNGSCLRGAACIYSHDLKRVPCKFFHLWRD